MLLKRLLLFSVIGSLLTACGGVIGNIEQYEFDVPKADLEQAIEQVFLEYPQMVKPDSIYNLDGTGYEDQFSYCIVEANDTKYVLKFSVLSEDSAHSSTLSLSSGAEYGETLKLARSIDSSNKQTYQDLFEKFFLDKVEQQLQM